MDISGTVQAINVDVLYTVSERTFLSPFFAFWIPVIAVCQNAPTFFKWSAVFFGLVSLRSLVRWTSRAWINRRWTRGQLDWSEQIVVVSGGSDGLGRVLVETLALKQITVVVLDLKPYNDAAHDEEGDVIFYQCDVSDPIAVQLTAKKIRDEVGSPTIVVNNAGKVNGKLIVELEPDDIKQTFGVNVFAHFYLLKAFLPEMIQRKSGHIITISSILGHVGVSQVSDYCASKAASILLHQSLRQELNSKYACHGVRTTLVCPAMMSTKMFENVMNQNNFLFPTISPHELVKKLIRSLDNQESSEIYVPVMSSLVWVLNWVVPSWVNEFGHWMVGSNQAMRKYQ